MKITPRYQQPLPQNNLRKQQTNPNFEGSKILPKVPDKVKLGAIAALFLLPTLKVVNNCTGTDNGNNIEIVDSPIDTADVKNYLDITPVQNHIVEGGENPGSIAKKYNVSTMRLLDANNMKSTDVIHIGDTLKIPEAYTVKNVKNADDITKLTGFSKEFLNSFIQMEGVKSEVYLDKNGNRTIGIGHYITPEEAGKFANKTLSDKEIYTLFGQDIINKDLNLETLIGKQAYKEMPLHLKESIMDLVFNKGEGALLENKPLVSALSKKDYASAVANLNQNYSIITKENGEKIRKYSSGLSKRRLFDMANASKIFKNGIPDNVLLSAKKVYLNGLNFMKEEVETGSIPKEAYENVQAEYKGLAYKWFNGKIGEELKGLDVQKTAPAHNVTPTAADNSKKVYINGEATGFTVNSLYESWKSGAKAQLRYVARPKPEIDANGNLKALVKILNPTGKGSLNGKTIIINPGHGGAMNHKDKKTGKLNVNFDPGTSNAVMDKKNPNKETNNFIANAGKSLEEWVVNERIANILVEKIRKEGGKVVFVQGSVYSAQKAIKNIQQSQKVNMIVSLHSNSAGDSRGIFIIGNKRGGAVDKGDLQLAEKIKNKMNQDSWFKGITHSKSQSLGVLSLDGTHTSPVPGVLIETGNLKNEKDVANLNSSDFKNRMVESIFASIKETLH